MTKLAKPVRRVSTDVLGGAHGSDKQRRIVVTLVPGNGKDVPDMIELRPERTRRARRAALVDVFSYLVRCEVNAKLMAKLRAKKQEKQERRERARLKRGIRRGLASERATAND